MDLRQERVQFETDRYRVTGTVTLAREGYRSRISDILNAGEREFIPLTDVELVAHAGGESARHEFMALSRAHIVFAVALGADGERFAALA